MIPNLWIRGRRQLRHREKALKWIPPEEALPWIRERKKQNWMKDGGGCCSWRVVSEFHGGGKWNWLGLS